MSDPFVDQLRARAQCIRSADYLHISEQDAKDFAGLMDKAAQQIEQSGVLISRAQTRLLAAEIASCTCDVKTDDPVYHDGMCRYRLIRLALDDMASAICGRHCDG